MPFPSRCRWWGWLAPAVLTAAAPWLPAQVPSPQVPTPPPIPVTEWSTPAPPVDGTAPTQGDWVVQRIDSDVDTLNPLITQTTNAQWITSIVINEGLLHQNYNTLKLEPNLAESWEISPDQLNYTFHLRHGVKWHDGAPFTAEDVKFSFDKLMDPKVDAAPIRSYFGSVKSCDIIDPYTVVFHASERYFKTLEVLGTGFLTILPKHCFDHGNPDFNHNEFNRHPIGTGPYKFVRWDSDQQIVMERNDDYWGGAQFYPKRLIYQIIGEPYIAAQLLKKGEIDAFDKVNPIQWERELQGTRSMQHLHQYVYPFPAYYYLGFNLRLPMFSDIRVRHALDLLMPRQKIIDEVYLGKYAQTTSGFDPVTAASYNHDVPVNPYDPAAAMKLLNDAGWKNDHGDGLLYKDGQPFSFSIVYPSGSPAAEKSTELIQETLRESGIDVKLDRLEFAQLVGHLEDWKFEATLAGWSLDINGDPWQIWNSADADVKKSSNNIGYKSAVADALMQQGKLEYDDDKRAAIYRQVHKVIHDDYPVCFLIAPKQILVVSDRYQNVNFYAPRPCFDLMKWWVPGPMQHYKN